MLGERKVRVGRVISDKMDKTVVVAVETPRRHRLYRKTIKRDVKYYAHDEKKQYHLGDLVEIKETRPLSRTKRWRVTRLLVKGEVAEIQPKEIT
ncbi:MAG: 30S ribosomal protein S17 [Chloroflexi bacterium]|nr:30S ribosomal protein S17 [Chloroflexota bacterium]